jgi:hypothetical protein
MHVCVCFVKVRNVSSITRHADADHCVRLKHCLNLYFTVQCQSQGMFVNRLPQ